jgi:antitoxin CptB
MSDLKTTSGSLYRELELRRKRLMFRWWHRGTQEIDLIFGSFVETALDAAQLDQFEALLDCSDADLFDWVTGRSAPPPEHDHHVMHLLRTSVGQLNL